MSLRGAQFKAGHAGGGDGEVFLMLKQFQPAVCTENSNPGVMMVKPTEDRV